MDRTYGLVLLVGILSQDVDRAQSPKHCSSVKNRTMGNVQNVNNCIFHITLNTSSSIHPTIQRYICWATDSVANYRYSFPCNRPYRPIGWDVEASTFSRRSAYRWRWSCQPYVSAVRYCPRRFLTLIPFRSWVDPQGQSGARQTRSIKKSNEIGNRTRSLLACRIMPQATTLPLHHYQNL
jgi:hypothetical protein